MPSGGSNFFYLALTHPNPRTSCRHQDHSPGQSDSGLQAATRVTHTLASTQHNAEARGLLGRFSPGGYGASRHFGPFYFPGLHFSARTVHSGPVWKGTCTVSQMGGKAATLLNPAVGTAVDSIIRWNCNLNFSSFNSCTQEYTVSE